MLSGSAPSVARDTRSLPSITVSPRIPLANPEFSAVFCITTFVSFVSGSI